MAAKKKESPPIPTIDDDEDEELEGLAGDGEDGRRKRTQPLNLAGLPDGVRAVLRLKPWRDAKEFSAYVYRREPDPQRPGRIAKKFCTRVYNTEIEESWLQERFPRGGRFSVMYQMPHPDKPGDVQIHSDDFEIDPSAGASLAPSVNGGQAPPAVQMAGGDLNAGINNIRALAEVVALLQGNRVESPAAPAWMEKLYQDKLKRLDDLEEKLQRKITGAVTVHTKEPEQPDAGWPDFLRPFAPKIKEFGIKSLDALASKLMGGGIEGAGLRWMVLNNPTFLAMWSDPEKRQAAAASIIGSLGEVGENLVRVIAEEMAKKGVE